MVRLDINASVPDSTLSRDIRNKPIVKPLFDGGVKTAAPIHVDVTGKPPGASSKRVDFIPSPERRRRILQARGVKVDRSSMTQRRGVTRHIGKDYLSAEDSKKARDRQDKQIKARAKEIWFSDTDNRKRYKSALKIIKSATEDEIENPSKKLQKALKVAEKKPITKSEAMRIARSQILKGSLS